MRIIAGRWGGRVLEAPRGRETRPTPDRVREALFSILGDLEGSAVLDLFAGTGAVALEALSRGAARAVCVERARAPLACLRSNAQALCAPLDVRPEDALRFLARTPEPFDLVFADPPWAQVERVLSEAGPLVAGWVRSGGRFVLERSARDAPPPRLPGFEFPSARRYGDAALLFYERAEDLVSGTGCAP